MSDPQCPVIKGRRGGGGERGSLLRAGRNWSSQPNLSASQMNKPTNFSLSHTLLGSHFYIHMSVCGPHTHTHTHRERERERERYREGKRECLTLLAVSCPGDRHCELTDSECRRAGGGLAGES